MMTSTAELRKAMKGVAILHAIVFARVGSFSIYFAGRVNALQGTEEEARSRAQKIEARIQRSSTLADAQKEARLAWETEAIGSRTLTAVMSNFSEAMQALLLVPVVTLGIAIHALWKTRHTQAPVRTQEPINEP